MLEVFKVFIQNLLWISNVPNFIMFKQAIWGGGGILLQSPLSLYDTCWIETVDIKQFAEMRTPGNDPNFALTAGIFGLNSGNHGDLFIDPAEPAAQKESLRQMIHANSTPYWIVAGRTCTSRSHSWELFLSASCLQWPRPADHTRPSLQMR